ncbi:MAG: Gfo/Idh/MocA family oxidoreductase, partial [Bacillota bacterium]|nr:Gfo/Idh/MocA family oxidoreductase [Bacillota bacterium]
MKDKLKIGVIGLGGRGYSLLDLVMLEMDDIEVVAVCDKYEDRAKAAADKVKEKRGNTPVCTLNYKDVLAMDEIDAVVIPTSWADHIHIAIEAMKAGKYAASEVGGAYSLDECWELVRTHEETGIPCMMLENCCYGRRELMVLNMVKQGLFGEIVHCEGGYRHDLRDEVSTGKEKRHYRLVNYLNRNCENYPTHELGPIAKVLNINRGNRMLSLNSTSSKSAGLHQYIVDKLGKDNYLADAK